MKHDELAKLAIKAKSKSYSPYSNFRVGSSLLCKDGTVYQGANIESPTYSLTICAERTAIFQAVLDGKKDFKAIAIASDAPGICPPCGSCRQVILDLCGKDIDVILVDSKDQIVVKNIKELIPLSFDESYLNI